jgi:DNA-binding response OmpR family regulator
MSPALHPQPTRAARQILVIEDERDIAELIALHLSDLPAEVTMAHDGPRGLELALAQSWDAIVLDLRLPGLGGLDLCREVRAQTSHVPILMLTARSSELDRVLGLELGADDYLSKPFSVLELQARMKALLRRSAVTTARLQFQVPLRSSPRSSKKASCASTACSGAPGWLAPNSR